MRRSIAIGLSVGAAALVAGYAASSGEDDPASSDVTIGSMFTGTYSASDSSGNCTNNSAPANTWAGYEPTSGTHPVFFWITGTGGDDQEDVSLKAIENAAKRGFVAFSVDFDDVEAMRTHTGYSGQAKCIFDKDLSGSPAHSACARARADCNKGIVAMGHSMGGIIASYGANNGGDVNAAIAYGLGPCTNHNVTCGWGASLLNYTSVEGGGTRQLPNSAYRIVDGEFEVENSFGFAIADTRVNLNKATGQSCQPATDPDSTLPYVGVDDCVNANGSGWYLVQDGYITGDEGHCWFHTTNGCTTVAGSQWLTNPPDHPADLRSHLAWLDGRAGE